MSIDLGETKLLCMSLWTLFKRSTVYGARKPKISNVNGMKICLLSEHAFSWLDTLLEAALLAACPTIQNSVLKFHKRGYSIQVHTNMFPFHPLVHHNICWLKCQSSFLWTSQEVHKHLILHRYYRLLKYIKNNIPEKVVHVIEAGCSLQWTHAPQRYLDTSSNKQVTTKQIENNGITFNLLLKTFSSLLKL